MNKAEQNNIENKFAFLGDVFKNIANEMARRMIEGIKEYQKNDELMYRDASPCKSR